MARTHARVKGRSGSTRPVNADLSFISLKKEEVVKLIIDLAKEDVTTSLIGLKLRDTYGIPSVKKLVGKSVSEILKEKDLLVAVPEDLNALVVKAKALRKHLSTNSRDIHNKRGLILIESKIRRLSSYYKKTGRVAANWKYN